MKHPGCRQSTRYFESVRYYVTKKEERQRIMSGNVTVLFLEQIYRLNKYRDEGIVDFRAIAVFHLSYRYFLQPGGLKGIQRSGTKYSIAVALR